VGQAASADGRFAASLADSCLLAYRKAWELCGKVGCLVFRLVQAIVIGGLACIVCVYFWVYVSYLADAPMRDVFVFFSTI
jgi:hypothetical protein